jgi:hypothetical protein
MPQTLDRGQVRPTSPDGAGLPFAQRLCRELESLEASLAFAEKAAVECQPTGHDPRAAGDVDGRLAELERRAAELERREKACEQHRMHLLRTQDTLRRSKDSLKRATLRFRAYVARRVEELDARERRQDALQIELVESRREIARQEMRCKAAVRESSRAIPVPL